MKPFLPALFLICYLVCFTSCESISEKKYLSQMESYMPLQPDTAAYWMEKIHFPEHLKGKDKADYWRLHAMIRRNTNKAYTTDSLLRYSISYYEQTNDSGYLHDCYRLEAQRQEWIKNQDSATYFYLRAIEVIPSQTSHSPAPALYEKLISLWLNHINKVDYPLSRFYSRRLIENADSMYYNYRLSTAYYSMALSYSWAEEHIDSCLYYTHKALFYTRLLPRDAQANYLADYANIKGMPLNERLDLLKDALSIENSPACPILCGLGYLYLEKGQTQEAQSAYQKAMALYHKQYTERSHESVTLRNRLYTLESCLAYATGKPNISGQSFIYNDSVSTAIYRNHKINSEIQERSHLMHEKELYLRLKQQQTEAMLIGSLAILLCIGMAVYFYIRHRKHRWVAAEERMEALERIIAEAQNSTPTDTAAPDGTFFRRILLQQLGIIRLIAASPTSANRELLHQFTHLHNETADKKHTLVWEDLYPIIDASYNNFYSKLTRRYGDRLNEKEIQLCCLLCADFSTKEINVVTEQSTSTIYHRKLDIRRKLELDETSNLSAFIRQLQSEE